MFLKVYNERDNNTAEKQHIVGLNMPMDSNIFFGYTKVLMKE
jgi:hypothetical protein